MDKKAKSYFAIIASLLVPGSGYVILGKQFRGLMMLLWMFVFGFITYNLAGENVSFIGHWSGGLAVWVLSVLDVYKITRKEA